MSVTGIILAGGLSSRMGNDKGVIQLDEQKMVEKVISILSPIVDRIIVSANNSNYEQFKFPVIKDKYGRIGPLGGMISCLEESTTDDNLILSCDTPRINTSSLNSLLKFSNEFEVVVPYHHGHFEPLAAYYNKGSLGYLIGQMKVGEYKLHNILKGLDFKAVTFPESEETLNEFFNINSKSDLIKYHDY